MGIDKKTLKQYLSLKQELIEIEKSIKKTEMEIERLIEDGSVAEVVTGGNGGKPLSLREINAQIIAVAQKSRTFKQKKDNP